MGRNVVVLPEPAAPSITATRPLRAVAYRIAASLPAWLLYAYLRLYRRAGRRGHRRNAW